MLAPIGVSDFALRGVPKRGGASTAIDVLLINSFGARSWTSGANKFAVCLNGKFSEVIVSRELGAVQYVIATPSPQISIIVVP